MTFVYEIRENCYGVKNGRKCKVIQFNKATNKESTLTQGSFPLQNAKMISSILISQTIDENKSRENKSAFPVQSVITQSDVYHMNQSLANHNSVNINTAFIFLPRKLGFQTTSEDNVFNSKEEKSWHNQKKGFASITITAKRVVPPSNNNIQANTFDPSCLECQENKQLITTVPTSGVTGLRKLSQSLHSQANDQNRSVNEITDSESRLQSCKRQSDWISNSPKRMIPSDNTHKKQTPLSFTSSVHLTISQQCPKTIYYVDKSLLVPVDQLQTNTQKMHRSVVSFHINCSSQNTTPDGVDSLANGKLITKVVKFPEDHKASFKAIWNSDLQDIYLDKKQRLEIETLGTEDFWKNASPSETLSVLTNPQEVDNLREIKNNDIPSSENPMTLSSYFPHWTYYEDAHGFSGSNRKQSRRDKYHELASASFLEQSSKKESIIDGRISLKDKHLPKGTSESKVQAFQNQKFSDLAHHIKISSKSLLDENDCNRKVLCSKGDYKLYGSASQSKEHKINVNKEMVNRLTTSAAHEPDVHHEKYEAFQLSEVCFEPEKIPASPLTLREALEVHKPHFISRSQERLKKLEHIVQLRKAQCESENLGKKQGTDLSCKLSSTSITSKKKQYTVPHPLSDNLFKPKERYISEKEMHMRSKRIYNNLPEVKKKQEEKQKRIIIQSNRKRVEIFKKQLLDQLLQRNTE
ncbi:(E2-independent) E3 ubiquitin-conjugating enzyme FATS isoform X2 [Pantherophis guttatus]|uniref:(E2-independent) E3 ubiquitin-conjugating enzyme FATS isoform X2 n=1 Tax=Pantherophis guttatus TaxID=94885 RepID=A0A6P9DM77_PANGU|nr:(E2-independent) E3 ubiquitin-conjugating enzyme FATS isoform X2 [Pantherophis guttatus]